MELSVQPIIQPSELYLIHAEIVQENVGRTLAWARHSLSDTRLANPTSSCRLARLLTTYLWIEIGFSILVLHLGM